MPREIRQLTLPLAPPPYPAHAAALEGAIAALEVLRAIADADSKEAHAPP